MLVKNILRVVRAAPCVRGVSSQARLVELTVDDDGIALLSMQRAPVNALNIDLLEALCQSFDEASNSKCKGMIVTSVSPKPSRHFIWYR